MTELDADDIGILKEMASDTGLRLDVFTKDRWREILQAATASTNGYGDYVDHKQAFAPYIDEDQSFSIAIRHWINLFLAYLSSSDFKLSGPSIVAWFSEDLQSMADYVITNTDLASISDAELLISTTANNELVKVLQDMEYDGSGSVAIRAIRQIKAVRQFLIDKISAIRIEQTEYELKESAHELLGRLDSYYADSKKCPLCLNDLENGCCKTCQMEIPFDDPRNY
jgi:hypothetical protein